MFIVSLHRRLPRGVSAFVLLALIAGVVRAERAVDPGPAAAAGRLSSIGSETMAPLLELWVEEFGHSHPEVAVSVQSSGSATAPPALADGVADIAPMSRMMNGLEVAAFVSRRGYEPTPVRVALDAVTVIVHRQNPVRGLTLAQLDGVFSSGRKCGSGEDFSLWGRLGLAGEWRTRPLQVFGQGPVSGTYEYFRQQALCGGAFKDSVATLPTSAALAEAVGNSLNGIGYAGLGHRNPAVRPIPLALSAGTPFIEPSAANALAGTYPLTRYLYIYVNKPPGQPLSVAVDAFIRLALSARGQQSVARVGYIPLPVGLITQELARLR